MNDIKSKVKVSSHITATILLILALIMFILTFSMGTILWQQFTDPFPFLANRLALNITVQFASTLLSCALCLYLAFMFFRIGKKRTPFFKELPLMIKILALATLLTFALPRWIGYALLSAARGITDFAVFDEVSITGLILAVVIFCLGHLFEYGYRLQVDHDEIV